MGSFAFARIVTMAACLACLAVAGCRTREEGGGPAPAEAAAVEAAPAAEAPAASRDEPDPLAPGRRMVSVRMGSTTAVAFHREGPPPWPKGNCRSLLMLTDEREAQLRRERRFEEIRAGEAHLANMHAENFAEIVKRLGLETVEVEYVGHRTCFAVDPRIPRDWLLSALCSCTPAPVREACGTRYAEMFRKG